MELYTVKLDNGNIGIIKAKDIDDAESKAEIKARRNECEVISVKLSTEDDIDWVEGMGGYIPKI